MKHNSKKYITQISDRRWWIYDIPGNIGWIMYIAVMIIGFLNHTKPIFSIVAALPAVLMLVGVIELIRERIAGLNRILPLYSLILGFGALTAGGCLGFLFGTCAMIKHFSVSHLLAALGGLLCFVFAGLLLKECKNQ